MKRNRKIIMPVTQDIFDPPHSQAAEEVSLHSGMQAMPSNRMEAFTAQEVAMPVEQIQSQSLLFRGEEAPAKPMPNLDDSLKILNIAAVIAGFFAVMAVLLIAGVVWEDTHFHTALRQSQFFKDNTYINTR